MSAKNLIIDFANLIFVILIIGGAILYFIAGDSFDNFKNILASLSPFGLFVILLLFKIRFSRGEREKREREGNLDLILRLNFMDKARSDVFMFSLPIAVCLIAFIVNREVTLLNFFQAAAVLLIAYWWKKWLFSKENL